MSDAPWLTIIGLGEDGPQGLSSASREALENAEIVMGPKRHLGLLPELSAKQVEWPVPFQEGIELLKGFRGRRVAVLASGDPFWFGAGAVIAAAFERHEFRTLPAPSTFTHAAARMSWAIESTLCIGLHAAPLSRLRPHLAPGARAIVLLRDGPAVSTLAHYLRDTGFGGGSLTVMEALAGPRERISRVSVAEALKGGFAHPVCVALEIEGEGAVLPAASGLADAFFASDGVMTKRPIRALTLSALAPRPGERLWDIGGGSGSVAIEWLLSHPRCAAITIEPRADRAALIRRNADDLGVDRLEIVEGRAPEALDGLPAPDAVFIGGGLDQAMLEALETRLASGTRLVANAVTLETEAVLTAWHARKGGELLRLEIARTAPLGAKTGWKAAYPVVQWSGVL